MENTINLGKYHTPTSWEELKFKQWQNYLRKQDESKDGNVTLIDTLEAFSDIPRNVIMQLPTDLFEAITSNLRWIMSEPNIDPSNKITINDEEYKINYLEKLRVKEYYDMNIILENDKFNYSALFAILCRKENEIYDEEFVADKFEERCKMFDNINAIEGMKLIGFFLNLYLTYEHRLQNSSMIQALKEELTELAKNISNSQKDMGCSILSRVRQIMILRKLKKFLSQI